MREFKGKVTAASCGHVDIRPGSRELRPLQEMMVHTGRYKDADGERGRRILQWAEEV